MVDRRGSSDAGRGDDADYAVRTELGGSPAPLASFGAAETLISMLHLSDLHVLDATSPGLGTGILRCEEIADAYPLKPLNFFFANGSSCVGEDCTISQSLRFNDLLPFLVDGSEKPSSPSRVSLSESVGGSRWAVLLAPLHAFKAGK